MIDYIFEAIDNGYKPYFDTNILELDDDQLKIEYEIAQHYMGDD